MFKKIIFKFLVISSLISVYTDNVRAKIILVLPSGGAAGVYSATFLKVIEETLERPTAELFDEIWASSIGSLIGSMVLSPNEGKKTPKFRASEVLEFLHEVFHANPLPFQATQIRRYITTRLGHSCRMSESLKPLRIMAAEVREWHRWMPWVPARTENKVYGLDYRDDCQVSDIVCGSCSVYPLMQPHKVAENGQEICHLIDSGCLLSSSPRMNPFMTIYAEYRYRNDYLEPAQFVFLGNGWFKWEETVPENVRRSLTVNVIEPCKKTIINQFKSESIIGKTLSPFLPHELVSANILGAGLVPTRWMQAHAEEITKTPMFLELIQLLRRR